jgi:hypothetical protein
MREYLKSEGWILVAGEYPGGSDHELYPLNVVDPSVARDNSPDPRRHSLREIIPDLVALRGRDLFIGEAKVGYSEKDRDKLDDLVNTRRLDLLGALRTFARERNVPAVLPVESLVLRPTLVFRETSEAPKVPAGFSYLRIQNMKQGYFEGALCQS